MNMKAAAKTAFFLVFLSMGSARAGPYNNPYSVEYTLHALGAGNWQYDFSLQGYFSANYGVQIYFLDIDDESSLADLQTGGPDWWTQALNWPGDYPGEFDITALKYNPDMTAQFDMTLHWSGSDAPVPHGDLFFVYDFTDPSWAVQLGEGITTPSPRVTPEPGSMLLLGCFLGLSGLLRRRK